MIQGDLHPDLLKRIVSPWATGRNLSTRQRTPSTFYINGKVYTVFLHTVIVPRAPMRKTHEIYVGFPHDQCFFVSKKEFSKFLLYIQKVAKSYLTHQTYQVKSVKSPPIMKSFYKQEFMANLAVFGSMTLCFLIYLIYPRFGWWNFVLVLLGIGASLLMGGFYGQLTYKHVEKKREVVSEGFYPLDTNCRDIIRAKHTPLSVYQENFMAEFPVDQKIVDTSPKPVKDIEHEADVKIEKDDKPKEVTVPPIEHLQPTDPRRKLHLKQSLRVFWIQCREKLTQIIEPLVLRIKTATSKYLGCGKKREKISRLF
jgi:hypothetical protein